MPAQFWSALLNAPAPTVDGAALASSTTLTTITPSTSTAPDFVIPANYLYAGQVLRVTGQGRFGTTGTPTLLIGVYYGGSAGVALAATSAITMPSTVTNLSWRFEAQIVVRATGTSGTAMGEGVFTYGSSATATLAGMAPGSAPAVATIDTTAAKALVLAAQWGTSNAANTITCHQWLVETLN